MQLLNKVAAQYFAPDEYTSLMKPMTDINVYTEKKKYRLMSEAADLVFSTLIRIQAVLLITRKFTAEKKHKKIKFFEGPSQQKKHDIVK